MTLDQMQKVAEQVDEMFFDAFEGIPVKVDSELHGNSYYICISLELSKELEKRNNAHRRTNIVAKNRTK